MNTALARLHQRRAELQQQLAAAQHFLAGFDNAIALLGDEPAAAPKPPRQVNRRAALPAPKRGRRPTAAPEAEAAAAAAPKAPKRGVIDRAEFERQWMANVSVSKIAAHFGVTESAIYMAKKNWGMPSRAGWPVDGKPAEQAAA